MAKRNLAMDSQQKSRFDYHLIETFEAGWNLKVIKSLRAGKAQLDSYVLLKDEAWLGAQIVPLETVYHSDRSYPNKEAFAP